MQCKKNNGVTFEDVIYCTGGFLYNAYKIDKNSENILLICNNNTFWFMTVMYIAIMITYLVMRQYRKKCYLGNGTVLVVISLLIILNYNKRYMLPWGIDTAFVGAVLILIGILYKNLEKEMQNISILKNDICRVFFVNALIGGYVVLIKINPGINMAVKEYGPYGLVSILFFIIISVISVVLYLGLFRTFSDNNLLNMFLAWIGRHGITFMAIQILIIRRCNAVVMKFTDNVYLIGFSSIVFTLIAGVVWGLIVEQFSDRINIFKYL